MFVNSNNKVIVDELYNMDLLDTMEISEETSTTSSIVTTMGTVQLQKMVLL